MRTLAHCLQILLIFGIFHHVFGSAKYQPNWTSLDSRPLPEWYDKAKIGIFVHWGVYSVPSFSSEWFWSTWVAGDDSCIQFMQRNYPPGFTYQDFAREFTAEFFNPDEWADIFEKSGAKYVVLTSKHHEGYTLWPSKFSYSWNAGDVGPHRDLLGDLAAAVRAKKGMHFGLYHSLLEWYHPLYQEDRDNKWRTTTFADDKFYPEITDMVNKYKPEVLWADGNWEAPDTYWKSREFLAWLYNESPVKDVIVTNDRWGSNTPCTHGGFFSCDDRFNPGVLQSHKWENAMTLDKNSWGYRRDIKLNDVLTEHELIVTIAQTVSCGGNILINVGPTKEGTIIPIFQERLLGLGQWLGVNGEAIYESKPWTAQEDSLTKGIWYTAKSPVVYAIVLDWPSDNVVKLGSTTSLLANKTSQVTLLGQTKQLTWASTGGHIAVTLPDRATVNTEWGWILKIVPGK